jgi:hypothetical protein
MAAERPALDAAKSAPAHTPGRSSRLLDRNNLTLFAVSPA